jgi:hypothetical protein
MKGPVIAGDYGIETGSMKLADEYGFWYAMSITVFGNTLCHRGSRAWLLVDYC